MKFFIFSLLIFTLITHQSAFADSHSRQVQTDNSRIIYIYTKDLSPFGGSTYYDFQSNGICKQIWQEPDNENNFHIAFIKDPTGNPSFSDRRASCIYSNDFGQSWTYLGPVMGNIISTFPCVSSTTDGRTVVLCNSAYNGGNVRTQIYLDIAPGVGSFQVLDPGGASSNYPVWPIGTVDSVNKIHFVAFSGEVYRNQCINLSPPGTFSGYTTIANTGSTNIYSIAASGSRVGIAYVTGTPSTYSEGSVIFFESTDRGVTWGTPVQIWNANYSTDSIGALRGVDITYRSSSPVVIFDLCKRGGGSFYPKSLSKIMSWSPNVNGGNPVLIDSAGGLTGRNPTNDVYSSVCRGVIGHNLEHPVICAAWCRARNDTDAVGNNYFDVWIAVSTNGGGNWVEKTRITNDSLPLRDCRYVSISPNNRDINTYYTAFHLVFQSDSVPGSYVNGSARSLAKMMYARIRYFTDAVNNNHTGVPQNFILYQNYPNPFNPATTIEYGLRKSANIKLVVYDVNGREVKTLDDGVKSAGYHSAEFETTGLASGVYFYRLEVSDGNKVVFTESKKMLLVK